MILFTTWASSTSVVPRKIVPKLHLGLCCVIPLILLALGIGGSWLSSLSLLKPYRPLFIGATLLLLTFAFHRIYLAPRVCDRESSRVQHNPIKGLRLAFWIASALAFGLIALPWLIPLFYLH